MLALLPALSACSKSARTAWRPELRRVFNNTSVQPPEPKRMMWSRQEDDVLLRRVGHADVAAVGRVRWVSTFSAFSSPKRVALTFRPTEVLHGSLDRLLDEGGEIAITLEAGQLDFHLALKLADHLSGRTYLLFLKEQPQPGQERIGGWEGSLYQPTPAPAKYFWALYRPEKRLLEEVRAMYAWLKNR